MKIEDLKFGNDGLIPRNSAGLLHQRGVNFGVHERKRASKISLEEGKTCFYSRSRKKLWRKGETSGNYQHIVSIKADCDLDALVIEVVKDGPACHLGTESCFSQGLYQSEEFKEFSYKQLFETIEGRKTNPKEGSYTTYLFR